MIRFGTHPIAWSNDDDPGLGGDTPVETILQEAAEIGFDGIETGRRFPQDPADLKAALAPHGLDLAAAWHPLSLLTRSVEEEREALQPHLDRLKALGCDICVACETSNAIFSDPGTPISRRPELADGDWPAFGTKLEALATQCAEQGISLVYHPHIGTVVQTPEEVDRLMLETGPNVKLLFDTGQCYFGGGDPVQTLTRHMPRVGHVHLRNVRVNVLTKTRMQDWSFLQGVREGVFTVPGDRDGSVDFQTVLNLLAASHYEGWLVIVAEQDPAARDPRTYQSMGLRTLRSMAEQAGFGA